MRRAGIPVTFQEQPSSTTGIPPIPDKDSNVETATASEAEEEGKYATRQSNSTCTSAGTTTTLTMETNIPRTSQVSTDASTFEKKKKAAGGISVQEVMKNPALARLLIQAAKKAKGLA